MNKCRLCQQINNNLTKVYSNRIKSLAQIVLKLKGFQDSFLEHKTVAICESCKDGIENVATFWENIPEAKSNNVFEKIEEKKLTVSSEVEVCALKQKLPTISLPGQEQYQYEPSCTSVETKLKPIKLHIKLPRKRKKEVKTICSVATTESAQKRTRRCPKRYESFYIKTPNETITCNDSTNATESIIFNDSSLNKLKVALLRTTNGQDIGKLVEVESKVSASKMRIICQVCSQIFCYERMFQKHLKLHNNSQLEEGNDFTKNYLFYCKLCDKPFRQHYAVRRHFKQAHSEERPLKCQHCEATFKYKFNLDYHMAKHVPAKNFQCVFCTKMFIKRYELQIHLRTHTKEKPYKCDHCSFAFAHRSNLNAHKRVKHLKHYPNQTTFQDSINIEKNTICNEKLKDNIFVPPQTLLEEAKQIQPDLNVKQVSKLEFSQTSKDLTCELNNDKIETNSFETENSSKSIAESVAQVIDTNDKKILKVSQPELGTFKLECNILKSLPSATLLGLKKWPKSFQCTSTTSLDYTKNSTFLDIKSSNSFKTDRTVRNDSEEPGNNSSSDKTRENASHTLVLENISENGTNFVKSLVKYNYLQRNSKQNSTQFTNNSSYNILNFVQPSEISTSSISNLKTNVQVYSKDKRTIELDPEHLGGVKQLQNIDRPMKGGLNIQSETNNSQFEKLNNARILKIENALHLKTPSTISSTNNNNTSPKPETSNEIVAKLKDNSLSFPANPPKSEITTNNLTNIPAIRSSSIHIPNCTTISKRSLLKPQQITTLALPNPNKNQTILSAKPLITKIEILPPLKILPTPQETVAINLVKPPTDYKYQCSSCYKYFKQKTNFVKHMRTHTGEKPYKCNLCPKSYADASNYKKHKILHKNAAELLNISRTTGYAVQNSPAYSIVSDPDPDGIEVMQTIEKFECAATEDESDFDDDASLTSSTMESDMWHEALEHALMNDEIRENMKRNLAGINNAILPTNM